MDYKKLLQAPDGWTDEQLLKEFKKAEAEVMEAGGPKADEESFKRLWDKIAGQTNRET